MRKLKSGIRRANQRIETKESIEAGKQDDVACVIMVLDNPFRVLEAKCQFLLPDGLIGLQNS